MAATMYLLDTNILSEILRPRPDAGVIGRLLEKPGHALFASELTRFELRRGAFLRKEPEPLWRAISEQILPIVQWLPVIEPISLRAGELSAALRRRGIEIGIVDTLLAATAQSRGLIMVTRNRRHFEPVPELVVENWFGAG
jgi:predicted nucleic acid-binding protein